MFVIPIHVGTRVHVFMELIQIYHSFVTAVKPSMEENSVKVLAKIKKYITACHCYKIDRTQKVGLEKNIHLQLRNCNFSEYVKFEAIS